LLTSGCCTTEHWTERTFSLIQIKATFGRRIVPKAVPLVLIGTSQSGLVFETLELGFGTGIRDGKDPSHKRAFFGSVLSGVGSLKPYGPTALCFRGDGHVLVQ